MSAAPWKNSFKKQNIGRFMFLTLFSLLWSAFQKLHASKALLKYQSKTGPVQRRLSKNQCLPSCWPMLPVWVSLRCLQSHCWVFACLYFSQGVETITMTTKTGIEGAKLSVAAIVRAKLEICATADVQGLAVPIWKSCALKTAKRPCKLRRSHSTEQITSATKNTWNFSRTARVTSTIWW